MQIIRITAMWCMSCLAMKKTWKQVFSEYDDIDIQDYDLDFDKDKVIPLEIGKILPVLIIYNDNKELARLVGEQSKKELTKIIKELHEKTI